MKIAIRADASTTLGLGHVKRCLSLAHALRERSAEVRFFARTIDTDVAPLVQSEGFASATCGSGPVIDETEDATCFLQANHLFAPDLVVVDHYALGAPWHHAVRRAAPLRLAAIDDLGDRALDVEWLIDPNFSNDHAAKHAGRLGPHTSLLGGPRYALLGPRYASAARHVLAPAVTSIGIFMGGTDAPNFSAIALDACDLAGFAGEVEIATTSANPNLGRLQDLQAARPRTRLTLDQPDLADFFARHDLHLGAGGGATWERCCIGAPTLALLAAPNQVPVLLPLQQLGVFDLVSAGPSDARAIAAPLARLLADAPRRAALSVAARALVDGRGAARVADQLTTIAP